MLLAFSSLKFWRHWKFRYTLIKLLYISVSDILRFPYFVIQLHPFLFFWKSPNLDDSTFWNYWIMPPNLYFRVCQWLCEEEDMKIIWQDKVVNIFCTGVCAASSISLQRPSPWENIFHSNSPFHWSFIFSSLREIVKSTINAKVMTHFSSANCGTNLILSIYSYINIILYATCSVYWSDV